MNLMKIFQLQPNLSLQNGGGETNEWTWLSMISACNKCISTMGGDDQLQLPAVDCSTRPPMDRSAAGKRLVASGSLALAAGVVSSVTGSLLCDRRTDRRRRCLRVASSLLFGIEPRRRAIRLSPFIESRKAFWSSRH